MMEQHPVGCLRRGGPYRAGASAQLAGGGAAQRAGSGREERFARMVAWQARRDPAASKQDIERQVLDYTATMPAWREHPRVLIR